MSLLSRAGELTIDDDVSSAREKLTLLVLADWSDTANNPRRFHVDLSDLGVQTIQSQGELRNTIRALTRKGLLTFGGFGESGDGALVLLDVHLHLPEVSA